MSKELDFHVYNPDNLLLQSEKAEVYLGYKILKFYVNEAGAIATEITPQLATFFLSPSGGTLRDSELNIVLYSAKFDKFKGLGRL
ncbi:MAG: hypothetical protein HQ472_09170 [Ignavibacteria bacterium]|nr:hypothetical protein [Ignavibacteria bacterium]